MLIGYRASGPTDLGQHLALISARPVTGAEGCEYCGGTFSPTLGGFLAFNLTVRNGGEQPIRYGDTCGTSLYISVIPASAVQVVPSPYELYSCPVAPREIDPGQTASIFAPVNDEALLRLTQRGTFTANLTLVWSYGNGPQESTTYLQSFTVS